MARINNLSNFLTDVATAIKNKKGSETPIPAASFDTEISNLPSQGVYQHKTATIVENGTITILPDTGYDAIDQLDITVNIPLQQKTYTFTQNTTTTIIPEQGYAGFSQINLEIEVSGGGGDIDLSDATISPDKVQIGEIGYGRTGRMVGTLPTTNSIANGTSDSHTMASLTQYSTTLEDGIKAEFDINSKSIVLANSKATMYITVDQIANLIGLTADKIKAGVVVLGISGTYTGEGGGAPDYTGTVPPSEYDIAVKTCLIILGELEEE